MGNEMGNQNINGLRVSEKERDESTEIPNQSPNASFISNDSDGLKALNGSISDNSPNSDDDKLATSELLKPKVDTSQPISSREYDDEQQSAKIATTESMKSLIVSNDENQILSNSSREYEKKQQPEQIATNESMKSLNVSNNEVDQIHSTFSKEYEAASEEQQQANVATNESMKSSIITKHEVDQIHSTPREFEVSTKELQSAEIVTNETNESMKSAIVSNDAEDKISKEENMKVINEFTEVLSISSSQKESSSYPLHEPQKQEAEKFGGNDSLKHMAISNDEEELSQLTLPRDDNDISDNNTLSTRNESFDTDNSLIQKLMPEEREEKVLLRESKEGSNEFEDGIIVDTLNEYIAGDHTNHQNNAQEVLVVISECSEQKALTNNTEVIGGFINQDGGQQHVEIDLPHEVFLPLRENKVSNEQIDVAYLDAIDFEINKLVIKDSVNEVNAASKSEANEDEYRSNKPLQEQNTDDIDANSFEILLESTDSYQEEKEREDGGLEEAVFEIAIQADYNQNFMSEKSRKESETERECASLKQRELIEYETEGLENDKIMKNFSRFSSLSDPVGMIVIEMNNSKAKQAAFVSNVSERNIMQLEDTEVKEKEAEDFNVMGSNLEEGSEQIDEEFGDQKLVDQTILVAIEQAASPQFLKEFEHERKEVIATGVNRDLNICVNLTQDELTSSETMISLPEGSKRFTTELSHENSNVGIDDATKSDGNDFGFSDAEENIKEVITKVCIQSSASSLKSNSEKSDKMSLVNFLNKDGTTAVETVEQKDGMNKTVEEQWESPSEKSMDSTARGRERHKSWSSSLFSNCMCCTTAIN